MSSIHYKFKNILEYKTLTFDGLHIGVEELKRVICEKESIRTESFNLILTNAHTKREYSTDELVPRNSSVVVQRIPRENALKLPKVQDTSTSGIVQKSTGFNLQNTTHSYIDQGEFSKMTEEQRLAHVKEVSYSKYQPINYQKRTSGIMSGPPPPTYVCNRCSQPGHWYKNCPLLSQRRTTGIPMEELMETSKDNPNAMLHPSGKFVIPIMHHQARLQRKHEPFPGSPQLEDEQQQQPKQQQAQAPDELSCRVCQGLLRNAVLATCCGDSFCDECVQQRLLEDPQRRCPGTGCSQQLSTDSLVPNKRMRDAVHLFLSNIVGTTTEQRNDTPEQFGANKPDITNTSSLLHKLLPDLAQAQIVREAKTNKAPIPSSAAPRAQFQVTQSSQQTQQYHLPVTNVPTASENSAQISQSQHFQAQLPAVTPVTLPPMFNPYTPPPPIPSATISTTITSVDRPSSRSEAMFTSPLTMPPQQSPLPDAGNLAVTNDGPGHVGSSARNLSSDQPLPPPGISSSVHKIQQQMLAGNPSSSADDLSSAWESFLRRKDATTESSVVGSKVPEISATIGHQLNQPVQPQEINDIWNNYLKQKDQVKKLQQQTNNSSTTTSSTSGASSRSNSRSSRSTTRSTSASSSTSHKQHHRRSGDSRRRPSPKRKRRSSHHHEDGSSQRPDYYGAAYAARPGSFGYNSHFAGDYGRPSRFSPPSMHRQRYSRSGPYFSQRMPRPPLFKRRDHRELSPIRNERRRKRTDSERTTDEKEERKEKDGKKERTHKGERKHEDEKKEKKAEVEELNEKAEDKEYKEDASKEAKMRKKSSKDKRHDKEKDKEKRKHRLKDVEDKPRDNEENAEEQEDKDIKMENEEKEDEWQEVNAEVEKDDHTEEKEPIKEDTPKEVKVRRKSEDKRHHDKEKDKGKQKRKHKSDEEEKEIDAIINDITIKTKKHKKKQKHKKLRKEKDEKKKRDKEEKNDNKKEKKKKEVKADERKEKREKEEKIDERKEKREKEEKADERKEKREKEEKADEKKDREKRCCKNMLDV